MPLKIKPLGLMKISRSGLFSEAFGVIVSGTERKLLDIMMFLFFFGKARDNPIFFGKEPRIYVMHSQELTWNPKIEVWKMSFVFISG